VCMCSCGNETTANWRHLVTGGTKSCGCLRKEVTSKQFSTHGDAKKSLYKVWQHIKERCYDETDKAYPNYGGRGIVMFEEWKQSYVPFKAYIDGELGLRPSKEYSLDRVNNDLGYLPGNLRWATRAVQNRNKRTSIHWAFDGRTQCVDDWASEVKIEPKTLRNRVMKLNWSVERALTTPVRKSN